MGVDISATHTIFFIAAVFVAVSVIGIFNGTVQDFNGKLQDRGNALSNELATDIQIINDPADVANNPVVIYVLNTGTRSLASSETIVLVNGVAYTTLTYDVLESTEDTVWRTGQVLQITISGLNLPSGDHRIKVIAPGGVADTLPINV